MSDAQGTLRGYALFVPPASSRRSLSGGALGTGGETLVQREAAADRNARQEAMRRALVLHGAPPEPPPAYQETSIAVVGEAAQQARRLATRAQVVGGLVSIVVSITLYVISVANGVVIMLAAIITGVAAGHLTLNIALRRRSKRRGGAQPSPPRQLSAGGSSDSAADRRVAAPAKTRAVRRRA